MAANGVAADRVTAPVDATQRRALPQSPVRWASAANDAGEVATDQPLEHLSVVLKRSDAQQREFEAFLAQQQDPSSPNFHRWLTPVQVGERFGASMNDVEAVTAWLRARGLRVDAVANSRMRIEFSGAAGQVAAAFATRLHSYLVNGESRMAPLGVPAIPAALSPIVQSVRGLTAIRARSYPRSATARGTLSATSDRPAATNCMGGICSHYIWPSDFATIYDLNSAYQQGINGSGQTIAIIGRARVYMPDVENFETLSGLPIKDPVVVIPPTGLDPGPPQASGSNAPPDQEEASADVERATSVAPGATIDLVVSASSANFDGVDVSTQYVVDTNPVLAQVMNISFGVCEADVGQSDVDFYDSLFSQAAAEGISVFVASGDSGAAGCDDSFSTPPAMQIASPNFICASSYATCVGGTEFADTVNPGAYWSSSSGAAFESALGYIPEGGWNEPLDGNGNPQPAASGGGVSVFIATPVWQTGPGVPGAQGRYTPDVAFSTSLHDGYFGCLASGGASCVADGHGGFTFDVFGGTSASTPSMAGIAALLNQKARAAQGNLNPRLYALAAVPGNTVFHDATLASSGVPGCSLAIPSMCNNSTPGPSGLGGGLEGYPVGTGYDEVTGLGSTDVANLLTAWSAAAAPNYQGLWWNAPAGSESGWGINFAHQGDTIFASWFTYDLSGKGWWLVMTAPKTAPGVYSGALYTTTGPAFDAMPFNPAQVVPNPVGTGTLTFSDLNDGTFAYTVNGFAQTKSITREAFAPLPVCATATGSLEAATNYTDLWWAAPAGSESGWGINLTQEGSTIFATWFTYDFDETPMWLVATAPETSPGVYSGALYRTVGPAFNAVPFSPAAVVATVVGSITFTFSDGNHASFAYLADGVSQIKALTREVFQPPGTVCH